MSMEGYPGQQQPSAIQVLQWYAIAGAIIALVGLGAKVVGDVIETVGAAKEAKAGHKYNRHPESYP